MAEPIPALLEAIAKEVRPRAGELRDLDAQIGDGDLGVTIQKGFDAVIAALPDLQGKSSGDQLARAGMAFNRAAASTFGVLFATALMRAGAAIKDRDDPGLSDVVPAGRAAMEGLMHRGKAKLGDKTLLDALAPAIDAFEEKEGAGGSLQECADAAVQACEKGVQDTVNMRSRVSRASWVGERSVGVQDPGATAVLYILQAAQKWVHSQDAGAG